MRCPFCGEPLHGIPPLSKEEWKCVNEDCSASRDLTEFYGSTQKEINENAGVTKKRGRKKVKAWKCLAEWSCCYKCNGSEDSYCAAPDSYRRVCKTIDGIKLYEGET